MVNIGTVVVNGGAKGGEPCEPDVVLGLLLDPAVVA